MNTTSASEFQADKNGTGNYFILLDSNPMTTFENVELLFLPGMVMQNATLVATLSMSSMMTSTNHDGNIDDDNIYHWLVILRESLE